MNKLLTLVGALLLSSSAMASPVATVNDTKIDSKELTSDYGQLNDMQKERINKDPNARREIVEGAINAELLYQAAKKSGAEQDEEFKRAMDRFKKQYLATKFLQKEIDAKLTKSAMKDFFEKHKAGYDSTQVRAYHILVADAGQAEKILAEAKAAKTLADFSKIAKKNSLDPTVAENGGDLGFFTRDRMVPEFAAAAFTMKKGEVKGPVRSMYGFHIIKVVDVKPGKVPNYDEVEGRVKEDLRSTLAQEAIIKLRSQSKVSVDEDGVRSLRF